MRRICKVFVVFILFITMIVPTFIVRNMAWGDDDDHLDDYYGCDCDDERILYVGRDLSTQGNWTESQYGDCGYALPYAELYTTEVAIGETTGIGESAHEYWWREPWSVQGEIYYPYEDYRGGEHILRYEVAGPKGPPRALVNASSPYYRPSWYYHNSSITVTLKGIIGNYRLSIYFLDWDAPSGGAHRKVEVNVTSSGSSDAVKLGETFPENFAAGTYTIFEVNSDGIIEIEVVNLDYPAYPERYAVIAGIFLDTVSGPVTGVRFVELDRGTKGNWRPSYGNAYYLLPAFNVPVSNVSYIPINKSYDETNINPANYEVSPGVCQYAADGARTYGEYPYTGQYAAYAWKDMNIDKWPPTTRVLIYPEDQIYYGYPPTPLNGRIYAQWDSGELGWPLNCFTMKVNIPVEGIFSIYALDMENIVLGGGRSETIEIWDESMTTLLDSQYISKGEINNGVYVKWYVCGPRTINIKVIADPGNLNCFINGIFLNCLGEWCGKTIGFWKNNIRKARLGWERGIQVSRPEILEALDTISGLYGNDSTWDLDWLTFIGDNDTRLGQALDILQFRGKAYDMEAKARAQILALLLTDTHYGKHFDAVWIGWYEGGKAKIIADWITTIFNEYKDKNYEMAKNLADYLNNVECADGYCGKTIGFLEGWNLMGVPLEPDDATIEAVFAENLTYVQVIYGYENGIWLYYIPGFEGSTLRSLEAGVGYWVAATMEFSVTINGTIPDRPSMADDWNLFSIVGLDPVGVEEYLSGYNWRVVYGWNSTTQSWMWNVKGAGGDLETLEPGHGYWVYIEPTK